MTITRSDFHHFIYLLGAMSLVVAMPLSHFAMGLIAFILMINWILEWNWKEKWERLKGQKECLLLALLFPVLSIGLLKSYPQLEGAGNPWQYLVAEIPLFFSPIMVATERYFNHKEFKAILISFISSTLFCCIFSIAIWFTREVSDIREISVFIDHIRFSLCVVLSIVFSIYLAVKAADVKTWLRYIMLALAGFFGAYLFFAQTLTGIVILFAITLVAIVHLLIKMPKSTKKTLFVSSLLLFLCFSAFYIGDITYNYYHTEDKIPAGAITHHGNPYTFDENSIIESGQHINYWVCRSELEQAWKQRSDTAYSPIIEATLIRYLNSKGMLKDYNNVMMLSTIDIYNIEHKIANYDYTRPFGLRRALYPTYFCISLYNKYGDIQSSSLLQRFELWKASRLAIQDNWLLGAGIGNHKAAVDQQLENLHSSIAHRHNRGSHNQFLTYWLMGGIFVLLYFIFIMIYPFFSRRHKLSFLYIAFFFIITLSLIAEDTLEAQTGRMLFAVFMPILMLYQENNSHRTTLYSSHNGQTSHSSSSCKN